MKNIKNIHFNYLILKWYSFKYHFRIKWNNLAYISCRTGWLTLNLNKCFSLGIKEMHELHIFYLFIYLFNKFLTTDIYTAKSRHLESHGNKKKFNIKSLQDTKAQPQIKIFMSIIYIIISNTVQDALFSMKN